jgi:hypothetical protein
VVTERNGFLPGLPANMLLAKPQHLHRYRAVTEDREAAQWQI